MDKPIVLLISGKAEYGKDAFAEIHVRTNLARKNNPNVWIICMPTKLQKSVFIHSLY